MGRLTAPRAIGIALALVCIVPSGTWAEWRAEYADAPREVRDWYANAELTLAARKRFNFVKCCDKAEVVHTRFGVATIDGSDVWYWLDGKTWREVPADVIHWGESAPGGQPTLFVHLGQPTCFFPGEGGQ